MRFPGRARWHPALDIEDRELAVYEIYTKVKFAYMYQHEPRTRINPTSPSFPVPLPLLHLASRALHDPSYHVDDFHWK